MKNNLEVNVDNVSEWQDVPSDVDFRCWIATVLQDVPPGIVNIQIVDEAQSQAFNKQYRGQDKPTNVLSFPFSSFDEMDVEENMIGDLVICAPIMQQEAKQQEKAQQAHWAHLTIHGTLHLLGYDHQSNLDAEEMESVEIKLLDQLGYPNPYE